VTIRRDRRLSRRRWAAIALAAGVGLGAAASGARLVQAQEQARARAIELRHSRFWRGTEDATLLEGVIGIRIPRGAGAGAAREVDLQVRDAAGRLLHSEQWQESVSPLVAAVARELGEAEISRPFTLALGAGGYSVTVLVREDGHTDSASFALESFTRAPLLSDIVLSARARELSDREEPELGEIRKSGHALSYAPRVVLTPYQADLWYYVELYNGGTAAASGQLDLAVLPATAGAAPVLTFQRQVQVPPGGAVTLARIDLTGLPPGDYRLSVDARSGARQEQRSAPFVMASFDAVPAAAATVASATLVEDRLLARYFSEGVRSDAAIRELIEALGIAPVGERVPGDVGQLTSEGQRRYLARVEFVNRQYGERDIGRPGVRTDRGRIYLTHGPPDTRLAEPISGSRAFEIWRYTRQRNLKYVFLDESGFSHYRLIMSTDPDEPSLPDWADRVGNNDAVRTILGF
jgi:hypothetical protein